MLLRGLRRVREQAGAQDSRGLMLQGDGRGSCLRMRRTGGCLHQRGRSPETLQPQPQEMIVPTRQPMNAAALVAWQPLQGMNPMEFPLPKYIACAWHVACHPHLYGRLYIQDSLVDSASRVAAGAWVRPWDCGRCALPQLGHTLSLRPRRMPAHGSLGSAQSAALAILTVPSLDCLNGVVFCMVSLAALQSIQAWTRCGAL